MSTYFLFLERRKYSYSFFYAYSQQLEYLEGSFIIDHTLTINLIRESELASSVNIDRSEVYILKNDTIVTVGKVEIKIGGTPVKFQVFSHNTNSEIAVVIGSPFMTTSYFDSNSI